MRVVLIGPQVVSEYLIKRNFKKSDLLIAVDGGVDQALSLGLKPHFAIGDWDSIKNKRSLNLINHCTLLKEKDRSDFYYALVLVSLLKISEVICIGFTRGRPDHHLGAIYDLSQFSKFFTKKIKKIQLICEEADYFFLSSQMKQLKLSLPKGKLLSIFSISGKAKGITLEGFQYLLKNSHLDSTSQGLSNIVRKKRCRIQLRKGQLVVIIPK